MEHSCIRPLDVDDAIALVGVLGALEALVSSGGFSEDEMWVLRHALSRGDAVLPHADQAEIAAALGALNSRLRATIE